MTAYSLVIFFTHTATTATYPLSLHDALPISTGAVAGTEAATQAWNAISRFDDRRAPAAMAARPNGALLSSKREIAFHRSEEHTSELQSLRHLVCRLLLEKKKKKHHNQLNRYS